MTDNKKDSVLRNGIWIKEQNGVLTMGKIGDESSQVELSQEFSSMLFKMENEMMDALYGGSSVPFDPSIVNVEKLFKELEKNIEKSHEIKIYCQKDSTISGNFDELLSLFSGLVNKSFSCSSGDDPQISITVSVVDNNLSIVYRDSCGCGKEDYFTEEIEFVQNRLKGKVNINNAGKFPYLDIMIPEKK